MSLKFDKDKQRLFLKYLKTPIHSHSGAEIADRVKSEFSKFSEMADEEGANANNNVQEEDIHVHSHDESGNADINDQALRVPETSRPVTLNDSPSDTTRPEAQVNIVAPTTINGKTDEERDAEDVDMEEEKEKENDVHVLVEDDGYAFSDHESMHHSATDESDEAEDFDGLDHQEVGTQNGLVPLTRAQFSRVSEVTQALVSGEFEELEFSSSEELNSFQRDLKVFLYYARRLDDAVPD
ncbi:unnamed protein product [Ambrosiozyma monospora]|uniref:Unnamed protein product n=1 Tax=Ambrosiozyma monospora TaxID=43982 RepID=A0ACB5TA17_AMBMO|nr:unnamed protein product [Ambrosiozyma monospora]